MFDKFFRWIAAGTPYKTLPEVTMGWLLAMETCPLLLEDGMS